MKANNKKKHEGLVPINCPYVYVDPNKIFNGTLAEVAQNVLNIKKKISEEIKKRNKEGEKIPGFTPFLPITAYELIELETNAYSEDIEMYVVAYRKMTAQEKKLAKEEKIKRELRNKKIAEARKKAAITKKAKKEEKDLALYEKLKKKFESRTP